MWTLGTPPLELVFRSGLIYLAFVAGLRLFGRREVGQFTLFDLALIVLTANALQPAMTGPDQSVPGGLIILVTIFVLDRLIADLHVRSPFVQRLIEFSPATIGLDGRWLPGELRRQGLDLEDVEAVLRKHGLESVEQVKLATLESDGSISNVARHSSGSGDASPETG